MKYRIKPHPDYFYLYQKFLLWWLPCYSKANFGAGFSWERVKSNNEKSLIKYCEAKNKKRAVFSLEDGSWVINLCEDT